MATINQNDTEKVDHARYDLCRSTLADTSAGPFNNGAGDVRDIYRASAGLNLSNLALL
jgi:hypothetical protein